MTHGRDWYSKHDELKEYNIYTISFFAHIYHIMFSGIINDNSPGKYLN